MHQHFKSLDVNNFGKIGSHFPNENAIILVSHQDFCHVGHHTPVSALYADNEDGDFIFHASLYPKVRFWGKSIEFSPKGVITVVLPK